MFPLAGMYRGQPPGTAVIPMQPPAQPQMMPPVPDGMPTGQPPMMSAPMQPMPTGEAPATATNTAAPGTGSGVNSPLFRALMLQKMSAGASTPQASGIGALGQASNPVAGALMAQRMGLLK